MFLAGFVLFSRAKGVYNFQEKDSHVTLSEAKCLPEVSADWLKPLGILHSLWSFRMTISL
jgi:hypothetical protein